MAWGLAYRAAPAEGFQAVVDDVVDNLLGKDRRALARVKRLVREGLGGTLAEGLAAEIESTLAHLGGERAGAGISRFTGRSRRDQCRVGVEVEDQRGEP